MSDNTKRILLAVVLVGSIIGLLIFRSKRQPKVDTEIQDKKVDVIVSQKATNASISEYKAQRGINTQREKDVAKNAVLEADEKDDMAILIEFGDLLQRAREYNKLHREE